MAMKEFNKFPSDFVSEQFVPYIDEAELDSLVTDLAAEVSKRFKGEDLVMIGLLKGSMVFMSDLIKKVKGVNIYIEFVQVDSIGRSKESPGTMIIKKDIKSNIQGRNVLIVEEIIDTGRALHFLHSRLQHANPRSIEILTLFDKPYKRITPIKPNYIGRQLDDKFVVGYGMDLENYGRNIKDLFYLKYPS